MRDPRNIAIGLDLDPCRLLTGKNHLSKQPSVRRRVKPLRKTSVTSPKADVVAACNFSFCVFKKRADLIAYFKSVLRSLGRTGILVLEQSGGPGMIQKCKERTSHNEPGLGRFTYVWDQKAFDPITHDAKYAIHFRFPDGRKIENAFEYDWRLWSIPELREAMEEAGFGSTHVYWNVGRRKDNKLVDFARRRRQTIGTPGLPTLWEQTRMSLKKPTRCTWPGDDELMIHYHDVSGACRCMTTESIWSS